MVTDENAVTRQKIRAQVLNLALDRETTGVTAKELRELGLGHHGTVSGCLSNLHKAGHLVRLESKRDNYRIYLHPEWSPQHASQDL